MGQWKIIVGKEKKTIQAIGKSKDSRKTVYYQIVSHDGNTYTIGDYEIVEIADISKTSKGELPSNILEIDGVYYEPKGSQKYMTDFNDIINVYIRDWKNAKPQYDITSVDLAIKHFKELIDIKNELLSLKKK